jgi:hypothetical protein
VGENNPEFIGIVYENAVPFETIALELLAGFGILGVLIGTAGSGVFVQKHLRV